MQDQKLETGYVVCAIPKEQLLEAGISEGDTIMMHVEGKRLIVEKYDGEQICNGDCKNCPINKEDCDGVCDECPCSELCDESEVGENAG